MTPCHKCRGTNHFHPSPSHLPMINSPPWTPAPVINFVPDSVASWTGSVPGAGSSTVAVSTEPVGRCGARRDRVLSRRHRQRDKRMPWVFWHTYRSRRTGETCQGPYGRRKRLLQGLCKQAGVSYFTYHALRHSGASVMDSIGVPIGSIQRILGHENRQTTETYLQSIGESEREAIAAFEQAGQDSHTNPHTNRPMGNRESG